LGLYRFEVHPVFVGQAFLPDSVRHGSHYRAQQSAHTATDVPLAIARACSVFWLLDRSPGVAQSGARWQLFSESPCRPAGMVQSRVTRCWRPKPARHGRWIDGVRLSAARLDWRTCRAGPTRLSPSGARSRSRAITYLESVQRLPPRCRSGSAKSAPVCARSASNGWKPVPTGAGPSTEHVDLTGFRKRTYGVIPGPGPDEPPREKMALNGTGTPLFEALVPFFEARKSDPKPGISVVYDAPRHPAWSAVTGHFRAIS